MELAQIVNPLLEWYGQNKRDLPWRKDQDSYHVWISEIMLQQTRVEAVKEYYLRFMKRLPTIYDLAEVDEDELLKLWQGLGYYNRARNLKKTAQIVVEKYNGKLPDKFLELIKLPGIGNYTAGAIASICFEEKVPAVDGNVLRVLARVLNSEKNIDLLETKKGCTELLQRILPEEIGDFNQALMELGALVCLPNGFPECEICPLQKLCKAYQNGTQMELPKRLSKKERKKEDRTILIFLCQDKISVIKRPDKGLLANLYEFPNIDSKLSLEEVKKYCKYKKIDVEHIFELGEAKHIFTHIEWHMKGYMIEISDFFANCEWISYTDLKERYSLPSAFKFYESKLLGHLNSMG